MKLRRARTYQLFPQTKSKAINITTSLIMVASSLGGALPFALVHNAYAAPIKVTPASTSGWQAVDDNGAGGSLSYVPGPANPPRGTGSAQLEVDNTNQGYMLFKSAYGGTKLADISTLSYSTYVQTGNNTIAPSLQINITRDVDASMPWQGRLVYEPYMNGPVTDGTWQNWNAATGKWWLSKSNLFGNNCGQGNPCTFQQLEKLYPSIGVNTGALQGVGFKAGSGWGSFVGNVDNFTFNNDTYDFEDSPSLTAGDFATWDNSPAFKGVDVGFFASDFGTVSNVTVDVARADGSHVVKTADTGILNLLSGKTTPTAASAPIIIQPGKYNEADGYWKPQTYTGLTTTTKWDASTEPRSATITVTGSVGTESITLPTLTQNDASHPAYDSFVPASEPTGLNAKFQYDASNVTNGATLNMTSKSGGNNLELLWTAPTGQVNGYHILSTYPDNSTHTGYQGPNTNAWLVPNGFGAHGQGKYTYQVVAVNPNGDSDPSALFTLYYDTTPPTATFVSAPATNSYVNSNFAVSGTAHDNVGLKNVAFDVRSKDGSTWVAGCVSGGSPVFSGANNTDATVSCDINTSHLVNNTTYMLRIHANDNAGYGNVNSDAVRYFTFDTSVPAAPQNLSAKFQYDAANVTNGATLNMTSKSGGNNLELLWDTPTGSWVTGHHILVTYPDGSTSMSYQGPNTNAWLAPYNGFGAHGQGKYTYQVVAVNPNGDSTPSEQFVLFYDTQSPTAQFTQAPANGSYLNGNFHVEATAADNVALKSVGFDVRDPHDTTGNAWRAGCVAGTFAITYNVDHTAATLSCDINTANLIDGSSYYVRVHAGDNAGYGSNDSVPLSVRNFTFDTSAPKVTDNFNVNMFTGDTTTLTPTVSGETGPVSYKWTPSDTKLLTNQNESVTGPTLEIGNAPKGAYTVGLTVSDQAGNTTTVTYQVNIATHANTSVIHAVSLLGGLGGGNVNTPDTTNGDTNAAPVDSTGSGNILGTSTSTTSGSQGKVKGDSTVNLKNASDNKSGHFLGLGWWWLAVVGGLALIWFLVGMYRRSDDN